MNSILKAAKNLQIAHYGYFPPKVRFNDNVNSIGSESTVLELWAKTSGTWANAATILLGTGCGLLLRGSLPKPIQQIMTQGLGLVTLVIGFTLANGLNQVQTGKIAGIILGLLAIVIGGIVGELCQLEDRLKQLGGRLKRWTRSGGSFTEGFVAASILFCVGPMALMGSLNNGISNDSTLLLVKSTMDGIAAVALSNSFGIGVGFSSIPVVVYQGGISILAAMFAQLIPDLTTNPQVLLTSGVGGIMILGIALNLLEVTQVHVASLLPALFIAPLLGLLSGRI
jgi:uncharacterized protein